MAIDYSEDFESGIGGWATSDGPATTFSRETSQKHSGTYALHVTWSGEDDGPGGSGVIPGFNGVKRTVTGLTIGTIYTFSAWGGIWQGGKQARIGVTGMPEVAYSTPSTSGPAPVWTEFTYTFTATATSHELYLQQVGSFGYAVWYWDDIKLVSHSVIYSQGFESGLDGWTAVSANTSVNWGIDGGHSGGGYLGHDSTTADSNFRLVNRVISGLTVGKRYSLTAWSQSPSPVNNKVGVVGIGSGAELTGGVVWKQHFYDFTATATSHTLSLMPKPIDSGFGGIWSSVWDDVVLSAPEENQPPVVTLTTRTNFHPASAATFAWSYSDPDGNPQSKWRLIIKQGATTKYDTGEVAGTATSRSVPGGTLQRGLAHTWTVQVWDSAGSTTTSATGNFTTLNNTPTAPTLQTVAPFYASVGPSSTFFWTFNDPDTGDKQTAYQFVVKQGATTIYDSGKQTSVASGLYFPDPNYFTAGVTYNWTVRTWDEANVAGPYATAQNFVPLNTAPAVTLNAPTLFDPALDKTLTWNYSDADTGDVQSKYRVVVKDGATTVVDTLTITSAGSAFVIAGGVLDYGKTYTWTVTVTDTRGPATTTSAQGSFKTASFPTPATLTPVGTPIAANTIPFSWTFNDPDAGATQSAYQLILQTADGASVVHDTGKVASATSGFTLPAGTLAKGTDYRWAVYTWDNFGLISPLSNWSTFATAADIAVTITAPADQAVLETSGTSVTWTTFAPDGSTQAQRRVRVIKVQDGSVHSDTGMTASGSKTHNITGLASGFRYRIEVSVISSVGVASEVASVEVLSDYANPNQPTAVVTADGAKVLITVTNPPRTGDRPAVTSNEIYRSGGGAYALVGTTGPNGSYTDHLVAAFKDYSYFVRAVAS